MIAPARRGRRWPGGRTQQRSGRADDRNSEADPFGVRLGTGRGEYVEGHRSRRGCYGQFILNIGVQLVLDIGLEGVRLPQGGSGRHRRLAAVAIIEDDVVAREVVGRGGYMGCPGGLERRRHQRHGCQDANPMIDEASRHRHSGPGCGERLRIHAARTRTGWHRISALPTVWIVGLSDIRCQAPSKNARLNAQFADSSRSIVVRESVLSSLFDLVLRRLPQGCRGRVCSAPPPPKVTKRRYAPRRARISLPAIWSREPGSSPPGCRPVPGRSSSSASDHRKTLRSRPEMSFPSGSLP